LSQTLTDFLGTAARRAANVVGSPAAI